MRRRDVIALIAGTAAGCLAIRARAQPSKTFTTGRLSLSTIGRARMLFSVNVWQIILHLSGRASGMTAYLQLRWGRGSFRC